jgi:hypothetical protein
MMPKPGISKLVEGLPAVTSGVVLGVLPTVATALIFERYTTSGGIGE